jgi:hypothetical protein
VLKIDEVLYYGIGKSKTEAKIKAAENFFSILVKKELNILVRGMATEKAEEMEQYNFNLPMTQIAGLKTLLL